MKRRVGILVVAAVCLFLVPHTFAAARTPQYLPEQKVVGGIAYLSGGIGREEQKSLRAAAKQYDLQLTFTTDSGAYLAQVRVAIDDETGERLLEVNADGPIFLVRLPAGRYTISAVSHEHLVAQDVNVTGKGLTKLNLKWPPTE